eukprot:6883427-Prymnesium_polylepis.1
MDRPSPPQSRLRGHGHGQIHRQPRLPRTADAQATLAVQPGKDTRAVAASHRAVQRRGSPARGRAPDASR